jgi:hypothetical protein
MERNLRTNPKERKERERERGKGNEGKKKVTFSPVLLLVSTGHRP